jgi:hypothetical protein
MFHGGFLVMGVGVGIDQFQLGLALSLAEKKGTDKHGSVSWCLVTEGL